MNSAALRADGAADFQILAAANSGNVLPTTRFTRTIEEAPGFAVFFEHGAGLTACVGIEADAFAVCDGRDGNDVPEVFRDDVGDEEIDFGGGVDLAVGSGGFDAVAGFRVAGGGFDLHAEESAVEFDDRIVAVAVSPRKADAESEVGGAREKGGLGGFSTTFAGGDCDGVDGDDFLRMRLGARAMDDVRHN